MLYKKLSEEEIQFCECFYNPVCLIETLIPENYKAPQTWAEKDCSLIKLRPYQFAMVDYSYMYADDDKLSKRENFQNKVGAGTVFNVMARNLGKSFFLVIDAFLTLIHGEADESCVASFDFAHLKKICTPIASFANHHPIFELYRRKGKDCVRFISGGMEVDTILGSVLYGKNENVGSPDPGTAFHSLHVKKLMYDEVSYMSDNGRKKMIDAASSDGVIERFCGIPDLKMGSPLGKMLRDESKRNWICSGPQYLREDWDEKAKARAIEEYDGETCFDDKTEILTDSGWKKWYQISLNDKVLSLNPKTRIADYYPIDNIYVYDYDGELNYFDNEYINFAVTDNHRMLISTLKKPNLGLVDMKTILDNKPIRKQSPKGIFENCINCGKKLSKIKKQKKFCSRECQNKYLTWNFYPVNKFFVPLWFKWLKKENKNDILFIQKINERQYKFNLNDWLEFLGWFISEGWTSYNPRYKKNKEKYLSSEIFISQCKSEQYINEISNVLKRLGVNVNYNKKAGRFCFNSSLIAKQLDEQCGKGARNKRVPSFIKNLSKEQINIFLDAFNKGDGDGNRTEYYTSSFELANDLQELIYKVGNESNILKNSALIYTITERPPSQHYIYKEQIEKKYYKGKVWCVHVEPFQTIFVRRFNKCIWTGNSPNYKLNILGEAIEGANSMFDMARIKENSYTTKRRVKQFEIGKETFDRFDKILVVDKQPAEMSIIASDIGTTGSPSEVCIFFGDTNLMKWRYNISLFMLTTQEQAKIFKWLYDRLDNCVISLDCTAGEGRSIADELVILGVPQDRIVRVMFNSKMVVGFEMNDDQTIKYDEKGNPIHKLERTIDFAVIQLEKILYHGLCEVPHSEKFLREFANYFSVMTGTSKRYGTTSTDHLLQSFQCFAIARFQNEFANLIKPSNQKQFVAGF